MQNNLAAVVLDMIVHEWRSLPRASRPRGIWIRHYAPYALRENILDDKMHPFAAWFADTHTVEQRDTWQWQRFYVMQCARVWCHRMATKEAVAVFGKRHEIGLAAFVIDENRAAYVETMWAHYGGKGYVFNLILTTKNKAVKRYGCHKRRRRICATFNSPPRCPNFP